MSEDGLITLEKFRDSMGLLGMESNGFFSERVFSSMDINISGSVLT